MSSNNVYGVIRIYWGQNMNTEYRSMLLKNRIQEPDADPGLFVIRWVGKVKLIISPPDTKSLAISSYLELVWDHAPGYFFQAICMTSTYCHQLSVDVKNIIQTSLC